MPDEHGDDDDLLVEDVTNNTIVPHAMFLSCRVAVSVNSIFQTKFFPQLGDGRTVFTPFENGHRLEVVRSVREELSQRLFDVVALAAAGFTSKVFQLFLCFRIELYSEQGAFYKRLGEGKGHTLGLERINA